MKKNNKKMILEIFIISLALSYLFYMILNINLKNINIFYSLLVGIISFELLIKYIREIYVYKTKYNYLKVLFIIINILILFICFITIYKKINILYLLISSIILLIYLIINIVINLRKLVKEEQKLFKLVKNSLLELISCFLIIECFIIVLIN